jgi:hypothetical protein
VYGPNPQVFPSDSENPGTGAMTSDDWEDWFEYIFKDLFHDVCDFADDWHDRGFVYATCEAILDARGIPKTGMKRSFGRALCIRKLTKAIEEAVCALEEWEESQQDPPETEGEGSDSSTDDENQEGPVGGGVI